MAGIEVVRVPDAPLSGGDPTRAWGVRADGAVLMPGLTRPEAQAAREWMAALPPADRPLALAEVVLPVVLSDGAGPYLLDATGSLVLVLGPHRQVQAAWVAMGAAGTRHLVGAVRSLPDGGWAWLARAEVPDDRRVAALDALDAVADRGGLGGWARGQGGVASTL